MKRAVIRAKYEGLIFDFRGYEVRVDIDLAWLYNVSTKD